MSQVFLNGQYMAMEDARVSVLDRGFTFADGVYEVIPVYKHQVFCLEEHIKRLTRSLTAIYIENPYSLEKWNEILTTLVKINPDNFQSLYVQVTRGVGERDHLIKPGMQPTVFIMNKSVDNSTLKKGISAVTREDIRWHRCDVKTIGLLPSVLLRYEASLEHAQEAILYRDNRVTEGAATSVFLVKDNIVKTPPKNNFILPGITRDLVVKIMKEASIPCYETEILREELVNADELWVTSSTWEIIPVIKLDGQPVNDGNIGNIWIESNKLYQQYIDQQTEMVE